MQQFSVEQRDFETYFLLSIFEDNFKEGWVLKKTVLIVKLLKYV